MQQKEFYKTKKGKSAPKSHGKSIKRQPRTCDSELKELQHNDVSWYTKHPSLAAAAGALYYGQRQGDPLELPGSARFAVPGLAVIQVLPTIGISTDASSSVNNMSRMIYSFIRHANSGSRNYEAADYMTYLIAIGSAYGFYSSLCRVYGLLRTYSVSNNYVNKAMVQALGFDFDDLINNMANFRYFINYFATRINSFAVPKDFTYYDRTAFLPLHVFKDNDTDKCSFYMIDYAGFFIWEGLAAGGSKLVLSDWGLTADKGLDAITAFGNQILDALFTNEDIGIMSGDTLKAYGSAGVREVQGIDENWSTIPLYDHDMLWQIHNARVYDVANVINDTDVTQSSNTGGGYLIYNPTLTGYDGPTFGTAPIILDSDVDNPTFQFTFENTRLTPILKSDASGFAACGSELPIKLTLYTFVESNGALTLDDVNVSDVSLESQIFNLTYLSTFKLHPLMYIQASNETQILYTMVYGDLNNYTQVHELFIKQLHDCALLSEFTVPNMAQAAK